MNRHSANHLLKIAGIAGLGAFIYATCVEPYQIELVRLEALCPRLPKAFDGFSILQISDIHMKSFSFRERQVQKIASQLNPSLIAYTGDLIHTESGIDGFLQLAKSIPSQHGAFAIYGNSEHKNGVESDKLTKILDSNGINVLVNDNQAISLGGEKIYICGVDDPTTWFDDIEKSFRGIPSESFKLLLMHNPDNIAQAAFYESDFVLSGHTHGGQVRLPLIGAPFTHSLYGVAMSSGYYGEKRLRKIVGRSPGCTQLYVSRGIGLSGANIRFLCRPEITLITLRSLMSKK